MCSPSTPTPPTPVDERHNYQVSELYPFFSQSAKYFHVIEYLVSNKPVCGKGFTAPSSRRGFPGLDSNESTCNTGDPRFNPWVRKIPWRREWLPTPVFLPGELYGQRRLAGSTELDTTEQLTVLGESALSQSSLYRAMFNPVVSLKWWSIRHCDREVVDPWRHKMMTTLIILLFK